MRIVVSLFVVLTCLLSCHQRSGGGENKNGLRVIGKTSEPKQRVVYQSEALQIHQLSAGIYQHTSFLLSDEYGKVDCNGMIVAKGGEAVVFDTPADNQSAEQLIRYVQDSLQCSILAVIPTHFHEDCVGGLEQFQLRQIPAHASHQTIGLLKKKNRVFPQPILAFSDSLVLSAGGSRIIARYFGAGHTTDNIVGYVPDEQALFGGCLIKAEDAAKGNLQDANVAAWPATVRTIKRTYPGAKIVIPGHGSWGGPGLLDYTIRLFEK